jgi:hypothetical protein
VGSEEGEKYGAISERGGVIGAAGSACGRWRRQCPIGLPEEEDGWPDDRAGPPVSEGETAGRGWAKRGRERVGPWRGQKGEGERWAAAGPKTRNGWIKFFRILFSIWIFGKLWKFTQ